MKDSDDEETGAESSWRNQPAQRTDEPETETPAVRWERWLEANRQAFESYNTWFEEHGLLLEDLHLL